LYLWDSERIKIVGHEGYELYKMLHEYWEMLGGRLMIEWDLGHFEA